MKKLIEDILLNKVTNEDLIVEEVDLEPSDNGKKVKIFMKKDAEDDDMDEAKSCREDDDMDSDEEDDDGEDMDEATEDGSVKKAENLTSKTTAPAGKGAKGEEEDGEDEAKKDAEIIKKSAPSTVTDPKGNVKGMAENADEDEDDMGDEEDDMEEMKRKKMKKESDDADEDDMDGEDDEDDMDESTDNDEDDVGGDKDMEENADEDEDDEEMDEATKIANKIIDSMLKTETTDVSEDIEALVNGDETLTEEFKEKAATIFEAAVSSKVHEEVVSLTKTFAKHVKTEVAAMQESLTDQLDKYLGYVVEEWIEANDVAVTNKLRVEIAEGFIATLKDAFTEHYIEMPDGKVDLFDEVSVKLDESVEAQKVAERKASKLAEELEQMKREKVIAEASEGLADTQVSKLKSLVEDVEFVSEEAFTKKVKTIKKSYFTKKAAIVESDEDDGRTITTIVEETDDEDISPDMKRYIKAASAIDKEGLKFNKIQ